LGWGEIQEGCVPLYAHYAALSAIIEKFNPDLAGRMATAEH
jgi:hypothetical protein